MPETTTPARSVNPLADPAARRALTDGIEPVPGVAKPDPRIFHAAATAVQVAPHEVLHVGDDATLDAHGALNAGMQAVWINSANHPWPHDDTPPHATVDSLTALCRLLA